MTLNFGDRSPLCFLCGATKHTAPERKFIGNDNGWICEKCLKEGSQVLEESTKKSTSS